MSAATPPAPPPEADPNAPERHTLPSFDGIRELDSNPPRLWTYIFALCFGAAVWVVVAYPAIPWFSGPTAGVFAWSSRADLAEAVQRAEAAAPDVAKRFAAASLEEAESDPALREYAIAGGHAAWGQGRPRLRHQQQRLGQPRPVQPVRALRHAGSGPAAAARHRL